MSWKLMVAIVTTSLASSGGVAAHDQLPDKLINAPAAVSGWGTGVSVRSDRRVLGGQATRVVTTGKEANVWDVGLYNPVTVPVASGDRLVLAFWARLERGPNGASSTVLPVNAIQMSSPPNAPVIKGEVTITPEWKLYQVSGYASQNFAAGELTAVLQLAGQDQTVDIGPICVFDLDRKQRK